jgi:segregation and condensation protein B
MNLKAKIESILFAAGRPVKMTELVKALQTDEEKIQGAIFEINSDRLESGITLLEQNRKFQLVTAPANSKVVTDFLNAEVRQHLTDAAIETLAIIAYKQPITRAEIEAIRGVNSQYIMRQLSIRGLIERETSADDSRRNVYRTSL